MEFILEKKSMSITVDDRMDEYLEFPPVVGCMDVRPHSHVCLCTWSSNIVPLRVANKVSSQGWILQNMLHGIEGRAETNIIRSDLRRLLVFVWDVDFHLFELQVKTLMG